MSKSTTSKTLGFTVVEALIIILVIAVLGGVGWYVYHKNHETKPFANNSSSTTATNPTKYFTLAQWGVRAPYSGGLTLTVQHIDNEHAVLSSKQLLDHPDSTGCIGANTENFVIQRYGPSEYVTDDRMNDTGTALTAAQTYAKSSMNLKKVGGYYYLYQTIKAPCAESVYNALPFFSQTDAAFKSITANLGSIPSNVSVSTDPYASWYTYTSSLGGFTIKYPSTWGISGFQGDNGSYVSPSQMNGTENEVRIVSNPAQDKSSRVNNFAVQISIQSWPGVSSPYDDYGNGTTTLLANKITLWQEKEHVNYATGPAIDTCPNIDIGTDDSYAMKLPNGKYLQVIGRFCWAQGQTTSESYAQQVTSTEWNDAINMIKSISYN